MQVFIVMVGAVCAIVVSVWFFSPDTARAVLRAIATPAYQVSEWEHGFKTDRVIATRYANKDFGVNIGFKFPKNGNDADRAEVSDFFEANGGWLFQGGGYYGAEAFVKFKDVTDKETANAKIQAILPALSQVIADLGAGKTVKIDKPASKYVWPDTEAPDKTDPYWEFNNNLNSNGVPYKKVEVEPGKWQWQIDKKSQEAMWKWESDKAELYAALRTRVLTDEELIRAKSLGISLATQNMVPYYEPEKRRELDDAFLQQARLRAVAGIQ